MPKSAKLDQKMDYVIECHRCGYRWTPNPKKWSNMSIVRQKGILCKVIFCPRCLAKNYLPLEEVRKLLNR